MTSDEPCLIRRRFAPWRAWTRSAALATCLAAIAGCSSAVTQRHVDRPQGTNQTYGAAKNHHYYFESELGRDRLVLTVFQEAECDVIRVRVIQRTEETLKGDRVVARSEPQLIQRTDGIQGTVPCEKTFARDMLVALKVGENTHRLGVTTARGEVAVDLDDVLRRSLYGEGGPAEARVLLEGHEIGTLSLAPLAQHEQRIDELLAEFRLLLGKTEPTPAEIASSYELYETLRQIAPRDPRVVGLQAQFLEQLYGRQELQRSKSLEQNLKALGAARELLTSAVGVPDFVRISIDRGQPSDEAIQWAELQVALSARAASGLCSGGAFRFARVGASDWPPSTQLALHFLRAVYSDPFERRIRSMCTRLGF